MEVSCLLLAAGQSSRMKGANKLMLEVDGEPLVRRTFREIQKAQLKEVVVVTGHQKEKVESSLADLSARTIFNQNFTTGMHSSIKRGLLSLDKPCDGFFVCLGDQPYFDQKVMEDLIHEFDRSEADGIYVPTFAGKRGHPVLISAKFIPEILEEPDRDAGCSYLMKRYPEKVREIPLSSAGILVDMDEPGDYEDYLRTRLETRDPALDFLKRVIELREAEESFAVASVIEVMGSASARVGSKAIFDREGNNLLGWIGGGCAERFVAEEAKAALATKQARVVLADLDDEVFGLGVACGGTIRVFIDPYVPLEVMPLPISGRFQDPLRLLCGMYGWKIRPDLSVDVPDSLGELLALLAQTAARQRGHSGQSMRLKEGVPARFSGLTSLSSKEVAIVGRSRITEALARHFVLLGFAVRVLGPDLDVKNYPTAAGCQCLETTYNLVDFRVGEIVVIASHTAQDPSLVKKALAAQASYVAMVGSLKRAREVLGYLDLLDRDVDVPLFVPAGLDIDSRNPEEIALSIVAEVWMEKSRHETNTLIESIRV